MEERKEVWDGEMVMKVKEGVGEEYGYLGEGVVLLS